MASSLLLGLALLMPAVALVVELRHEVGPSERHHAHHTTYTASARFTRVLVIEMVLMGVLGFMLGWLCTLGVFTAPPVALLAFFDSFIAVLLVAWACARRYRVVTYDDRMVVRPFAGASQTVVYEDILRMEWVRPVVPTRLTGVRVYAAEAKPVTLLGLVDVEQVLIAVNRFDVMDETGGAR